MCFLFACHFKTIAWLSQRHKNVPRMSVCISVTSCTDWVKSQNIFSFRGWTFKMLINISIQLPLEGFYLFPTSFFYLEHLHQLSFLLFFWRQWGLTCHIYASESIRQKPAVWSVQLCKKTAVHKQRANPANHLTL